MAILRGRAEVSRYINALPEAIKSKLLRGAARAGGKVIADEARERTTSDLVRENITIRTRETDDKMIVRIGVKAGYARSLGVWLEWGTAAHYITVDDAQRDGKTARRINKQLATGTLVINGQPIGKTVFHPGAKPHPFLRPAQDLKERDAIAAAQSYIITKLRRGNLLSLPDDEGPDE